jgi:BON domain-containing protein
MSHYGAESAPGTEGAQGLDYRVAHLSERLAAGDLGELGVRAEIRGQAVLLTGTVPSAQCRDEVLRITHETLAGTPVHCDLVVADTSAPDHAEELT